MFLCFTFAIGAHSISKEVACFSPLWFPRGKFFVSLVIISMHVILSDKILISYCLNDKNLTYKLTTNDRHEQETNMGSKRR